jgi:hypothetical protein
MKKQVCLVLLHLYHDMHCSTAALHFDSQRARTIYQLGMLFPSLARSSIAPVSRSAAITSLDVFPLDASRIDGWVESHLNAMGCGRLWWLLQPMEPFGDE